LPFTARHDHIDEKVVNMHCQCDKSVDATTTLVSAMVVVVRLLLLIRGPFWEGAR
jgi:hypothetical protein